MKRKLFVIFQGRFPSERAAALFAAENARSFSDTFDVTILAPRRAKRDLRGAGVAYNLPANIHTLYLPVFDLFWIPGFSRIAFYISGITFSFFLRRYLRTNVTENDVLVANDLISGLGASHTRGRLVFEVHDFPEHNLSLYKRLFSRSSRIIATNQWKYDALSKLFPEYKERLIMERNGVDSAMFESAPSKIEARRTFSLPKEQKIVAYTGHLFGWKGVDILLEAAKTLPDFLFIFVGGTESDVASYRARYSNHQNIRFIGHVLHEEIPVWQAAADILVLPNTAQEEISAHYTSPMKLFEYMASGRPIVASRIPSIAEVVTDDMVYFFEADNGSSLATSIETACYSSEESSKKSEAARSAVLSHTWTQRAARLTPYL